MKRKPIFFFFAILKGHRNCARMKEASNWISLKKRFKTANSFKKRKKGLGLTKISWTVFDPLKRLIFKANQD